MEKVILWISFLGFAFLSRPALAVDEFAVPKAISVEDADVPRRAILSMMNDGADLMGRSGIMYSFPKSEDFVSLVTQTGYWFDKRWRIICEIYRSQLRTHSPFSFLDVGANIGSFAVPVALCLQNLNASLARPGVGGEVIVIEALHRHVAMLKANLRVNFVKRALVFPYAVSSKTSAPRSMYTDSKNKCHSSLVGNFEAEYGDNSTRTSKVLVTTIDAIYHAFPNVMRRVLVMKIDIEGYEGHALFGATRLLSEMPPCFIFVELKKHWLRQARTPFDKVLAFLRSKGYEVGSGDDLERSSATEFDVMFRIRNLAGCIKSKRFQGVV